MWRPNGWCTTATAVFVHRVHHRSWIQDGAAASPNFCKPPPQGKCFMHARAPSTSFRRKKRRAISLVHKTNRLHRQWYSRRLAPQHTHPNRIQGISLVRANKPCNQHASCCVRKQHGYYSSYQRKKTSRVHALKIEGSCPHSCTKQIARRRRHDDVVHAWLGHRLRLYLETKRDRQTMGPKSNNGHARHKT